MKIQGWHCLDYVRGVMRLWLEHFRVRGSSPEVDRFAFLNSAGGRIYSSDITKNLAVAVARFGSVELYNTRAFTPTALRALNETTVSRKFGTGDALSTFRRSDMHSSDVAERHYNKENATQIATAAYSVLAEAAGDLTSFVKSSPSLSASASSDDASISALVSSLRRAPSSYTVDSDSDEDYLPQQGTICDDNLRSSSRRPLPSSQSSSSSSPVLHHPVTKRRRKLHPARDLTPPLQSSPVNTGSEDDDDNIPLVSFLPLPTSE